MKEVLDDIERWQAAGHRVAVARVVGTEGSSPRDPGATMAVNDAGEVAGSVSGGCVEGAVVQEALAILAGDKERGIVTLRVLRRRRVRGRAHVRRHDPPLRGALGLVSRYEELRDALRAGEPVALATVIEGPNLGAKLLVRPDGAPTGSLGDAEPRSGRRARRARRARGRAHVDPALRRARRGARARGQRVHRVVRAAAAHDHLRRGRLHRRAGQGREGARLPRDGVRRPRGVRDGAAVPDGRRGRQRLARPLSRQGRRRARPARRGLRAHPRPQVRRPGHRGRGQDGGRLPRRDGLAAHARAAQRCACARPG